MADRWTQFLTHPATQMAAGIMAGSDPNREGLGGVGQGIMAAGEGVRQQQLDRQRAQMLQSQQEYRDFQMMQAQAKAEQQAQQRQAREDLFAQMDPETAALYRAFPAQAAETLFRGPMVVPKGGSVYQGGRFRQPAGTVDPDVFKGEWSVRKDIQKADATFAEVSNRASQIMQLVNTPGGFADVALVNNLAKFMDPGSVVRPSETQTIQEAGGYFNQLTSMLQSVAGKGTITPAVRRDIVKVMNKLMGIYRKEYDARRADTRDFLRKRNQRLDVMGSPLSFPEFSYTDVDEKAEAAEVEAMLREAEAL